MSLLSDTKTITRFAWQLPGFLRNSISFDEAKTVVRRHLAERDENFLRVIQHGIFGHPGSPYLPLLKLAGCEFGDIRAMVRKEGLEVALKNLCAEGVYVTFEEFKGRTPITRGGQVFEVEAKDFDNPYLSRCYYATSGGTTGAGTRVMVDLDFLRDTVPMRMLAFEAHGLRKVPTAMWYGLPPDSTAINNMLRAACFGNVPKRWFTPITGRDIGTSLANRLLTQYVVRMGRICGHPMPWPEPLLLEEAAVIARWMEETVRKCGASLLRAHVSMAVRVSLAAQAEGLDLTGATFMGGGEPPTPAKVREIRRCGARWIPTYVASESGPIGWGCANPIDENDHHFLEDTLALIQQPRRVPGPEVTVNAFYLTGLLPTAPKLMLNIENDDYGVFESRSCGCPFEEYGLRKHLRNIRSFTKLTGEGVTLAGSELLRVLEETLPARFGGTPLDYQFSEEEDESGFTRLNLIISNRVQIPSEEAVIETIMDELSRGTFSAGLAGVVWWKAGTLRVKRAAPIWTARGKLNPLHLSHERRGQRPDP